MISLTRLGRATFLGWVILSTPLGRCDESLSPREASRKFTIEDRAFRTGGREVLSLHKFNYDIIGGNDLKRHECIK